MKRLHWSVGFFAACAAVLVISCGGSSTDEGPPVVTSSPSFSLGQDITTQIQFDIGVAHNAAMDDLDAINAEPGSMTMATFLTELKNAINAGLSPYQPSRSVTKQEVGLAIGIGRLVDTLYDLHFEDDGRADAVAVLEYWESTEFISTEEFDQLVELFTQTTPQGFAVVSQEILEDPVSDAVAAGVAVFVASLDYWSQGGTIPIVQGEEDEPTKGLRTILGDTLGGIAGTVIGGGIAGYILCGAFSALFHVDSGCWPDPCGGSTGNDTTAPCGGYTGVGPCP